MLLGCSFGCMLCIVFRVLICEYFMCGRGVLSVRVSRSDGKPTWVVAWDCFRNFWGSRDAVERCNLQTQCVRMFENVAYYIPCFVTRAQVISSKRKCLGKGDAPSLQATRAETRLTVYRAHASVDPERLRRSRST